MTVTPFPSSNADLADMVDLKDSSALLGSRICHDLISPLGAISNGLELLRMSGMDNSPELQLIEESVANANARIKFFRLAFGAASGSQIMPRNEVLKLIDETYGPTRTVARWNPLSDPSRVEAKIGCLALMCAETALPQGGEIVIDTDRDIWAVKAFGPQIRFDAATWSLLSGHPLEEGFGSAQVQFLLLRDALRETQNGVQVGHSDSAVSLQYGPR